MGQLPCRPAITEAAASGLAAINKHVQTLNATRLTNTAIPRGHMPNSTPLCSGLSTAYTGPRLARRGKANLPPSRVRAEARVMARCGLEFGSSPSEVNTRGRESRPCNSRVTEGLEPAELVSNASKVQRAKNLAFSAFSVAERKGQAETPYSWAFFATHLRPSGEHPLASRPLQYGMPAVGMSSAATPAVYPPGLTIFERVVRIITPDVLSVF